MELKIPPLVQVILFGAAILLVSKLFPSLTLSIPANRTIGGLLIIVGVIAALLGIIEFNKAKTTIDPRCPEKTDYLVITGIYRISRNPMYLGFLIILLGCVVISENIATLLLLPVFVLAINSSQIKPEERFLSKKFGSNYSEYCSRVRRWV